MGWLLVHMGVKWDSDFDVSGQDWPSFEVVPLAWFAPSEIAKFRISRQKNESGFLFYENPATPAERSNVRGLRFCYWNQWHDSTFGKFGWVLSKDVIHFGNSREVTRRRLWICDCFNVLSSNYSIQLSTECVQFHHWQIWKEICNSFTNAAKLFSLLIWRYSETRRRSESRHHVNTTKQRFILHMVLNPLAINFFCIHDICVAYCKPWNSPGEQLPSLGTHSEPWVPFDNLAQCENSQRPSWVDSIASTYSSILPHIDCTVRVSPSRWQKDRHYLGNILVDIIVEILLRNKCEVGTAEAEGVSSPLSTFLTAWWWCPCAFAFCSAGTVWGTGFSFFALSITSNKQLVKLRKFIKQNWMHLISTNTESRLVKVCHFPLALVRDIPGSFVIPQVLFRLPELVVDRVPMAALRGSGVRNN